MLACLKILSPLEQGPVIPFVLSPASYVAAPAKTMLWAAGDSSGERPGWLEGSQGRHTVVLTSAARVYMGAADSVGLWGSQ